MAENSFYLEGRVYWFKGLPDQLTFNEYAGEKQWSFDLEATPAIKNFLKANGLTEKLKKNKEGVLKTTPDGDNFITFKRPELTRDNEPNKPWRVVDRSGAPWNSEVKIGNGSTVRVKVTVKDWTVGKSKVRSLYCQAIQVGNLVEFVSNEFPAWEEEESAAPAPRRDDLADMLDDENPFD
jgi:hypothetical protein